MFGHRTLAVAAIGAMLAAAGCSPVGEPWDKTGYFEGHRTLPAGVDKQLQHRLFHTQRDQERPAHHAG